MRVEPDLHLCPPPCCGGSAAGHSGSPGRCPYPGTCCLARGCWPDTPAFGSPLRGSSAARDSPGRRAGTPCRTGSTGSRRARSDPRLPCPGEADLDNRRCEWEALCVTRQTFRPAASTARPLCLERPGASAQQPVSVPPPVPLPAPGGAAYDLHIPLGTNFTTLTPWTTAVDQIQSAERTSGPPASRAWTSQPQPVRPRQRPKGSTSPVAHPPTRSPPSRARKPNALQTQELKTFSGSQWSPPSAVVAAQSPAPCGAIRHGA